MLSLSGFSESWCVCNSLCSF
uniref:Uncharacterized protein n=1 Tax=Anguilla anguilla TaxID=7936 RepID=A0A0E9U3C8_ANGAN